MNYKIGKIGSAEGMVLIVMMLVPSMYMMEPCMTIRYAGNSAWLMKLIGGFVMLALVLIKFGYYQGYLQQYSDNKNVPFEKFLTSILGRSGALVFIMAWAAVFFIQTSMLLRQLADNTVMLAMPGLSMELVALLLAASAYLLSRYGLEVLLRCSYIFFLLGISGIVFLLTGLIPEYNLLELAPWQGYGIDSTLWYGLLDSGTWLGGFAIFALASNLQKIHTFRRAVKRGFIITILIKAVMLACLLMMFGGTVAAERTQLFYEAVRSLHFSQYIQRLDSIFIFIWLTGGILSTTLSLYMTVSFFGLAFRLTDIRPLLPLGAAIAAGLAVMPSGVMEIFALGELFLYEGGTIFMLADFIIISLAYYLFKRRKRLCRS